MREIRKPSERFRNISFTSNLKVNQAINIVNKTKKLKAIVLSFSKSGNAANVQANGKTYLVVYESNGWMVQN